MTCLCLGDRSSAGPAAVCTSHGHIRCRQSKDMVHVAKKVLAINEERTVDWYLQFQVPQKLEAIFPKQVCLDGKRILLIMPFLLLLLGLIFLVRFQWNNNPLLLFTDPTMVEALPVEHFSQQASHMTHQQHLQMGLRKGMAFFFWLVAAWVKSRAERPSVSVVNRQLHVQIGCKLGIRNRKDELEASKAKQITN